MASLQNGQFTLMAQPERALEFIAAVIFALAILHTFGTKFFHKLAQVQPRHAGVWHLLAEVEVVFGFWALVLVLAIFAFQGGKAAVEYVDSRNFTEPLFVFAIMVIAATRPVMQAAMGLVRLISALLPLPGSMGHFFVIMAVVPLLGSFITEPAAMTLGALMLSETILGRREISSRLKYGTIGTLFVNVSIGGTLTPFAAPPVLMVANAWGWGLEFMMTTFGWRAAIAVGVNALALTLLFRKELAALPVARGPHGRGRVPAPLVVVHLAFLAGVVVFAHHPSIFLGLFLFFLGVTHAYERHQDKLMLREGLLVAFFLAGLVVLGGQQQWWLKPLLLGMDANAVYFGATALTAVTDNAALTYLGSLVPGLSDEFKYALVAGAVTGGGLTVIANAPNPAGMALLRKHFDDESVSPLWLFVAALAPTIVAIVAFRFL